MTLEAKLLAEFATTHPIRAARVLESMEIEGAADVLNAMAVEVAATLLPRLTPLFASKSLELVDSEHAAHVLSATRQDAAAPILRAMGARRRASVVESMSPQARKTVKPLLRYSEGTAGALMDPAVPSVLETASMGETLGQLRKSPQHALYYVYVVDEDQKLVGVVNMRELLEARPEEVVGLKAVRTVDSLSVRAGSEAVITHPAWKRFHALPVVEADGRLLGVIRYKSVRELEERFVETGLRDHGAETAAAIGELYGLGFRALFEWGATALLGSTEQRRRGR